MAIVQMYTTMTCGSCIRAKRALAALGVVPEEIDVTFDREAMIQRTGRITVPQILVDGTLIGGYEDLLAAIRSGSFQDLAGIDGTLGASR